MKKIIFNENSFIKFKKHVIKEAIVSTQYLFGTEKHNFKIELDALSKISNLRTDRYKNYDLENAYEEWGNTGFDKSSNEYRIWCGNLQSFMEYIGKSIYYVLTDKVERAGSTRPHYAFLDPEWVKKVVRGGQEEHQSIYCLTLKLYQNKVIWNDLFFNPIFNDLKEALKKIRGFANKQKILNPNFKLLLPIEEYNEIGLAMKPENAKPELFYEPISETNNTHKDNFNDVDITIDDWG